MLAANVDLALVTEPLPDPKARRLERFAALAASGGVPVALVLTKADLDEEAQVAATRLGRRLGVVDAVAVSAVTGEGMGILRHLLTPGTTAVLLGASGTGKSTLVNALLGEERQKTGEVRASDRRGRHTTVTRELLALPGGAHLIDTPGIRVAGLWDGTGESLRRRRLARAAVPLRRTAATTPSRAARSGEASTPERIAAWRKLQRELAWVEDRRAAPRARDAVAQARSPASSGSDQGMRAGEGNRTPIFGLGSQRLGHWTTPARVESVTDADTLPACACASSGPSPSPPRRSSGCSRTGWSPRAPTRRSTTRWPRASARPRRSPRCPWLQKTGSGSLADYKGKVVVLNVWASWCDPCREEVPLLQRTHEQIEAKGGVVLGLDTQDARDKALEFLAERKATFPSLRDRDRSYGREFGVTGYPETFLIDRQGRIAALQRFPVTQAWLDQHLPKLLAEQA